ncbi:MAG TPA: hypothetical protein VGA78_17175 [Gemmatimonadales bacterium]|jgi:hypothetical protein
MSDVTPEATAEIEALLADRQRLQEWLDRLESTAERAPAGVRQRVRADYEGRLTEVVARLRGYSTALSASLAALRTHRADYQSQRTEVEEARAEAELRHAVGEYSDEDWTRLESDAGQRINAFTVEIDRLSAEISRLEDVLSQVSPPQERARPQAPPPQPRPAPRQPAPAPHQEERLEIHVLERDEITLTARGPQGTDDSQNVVTLDPDHMDDIEAIRPETPRPTPIEAPRFTPKSGPEHRPPTRVPTAPRTLRFPAPPIPEIPSAPSVDEMTFLKSVTLDSPASRERSAAENRPSAPPKGRGAGASKTLKCAECGSMNRPTEWYCERCGAELAAL